MSAKALFFLIHFIGVGAIIIGYFISPFVFGLGITVIAANAIGMGFVCYITFK